MPDMLTPAEWRRFTATPRLRGILDVSEEKGLWIKGTLAADPDVSVEISFEVCEFAQYRLPGTNITYMGAFKGRKALMEFSLGVLCVKPDAVTYDTFLAPLIVRLGTYRPINVAQSMFQR